MKYILLLMLILVPVTSFSQNKIIRDTRTNEVVEIWRHEGNRTSVWTRDNEPLYTRYRDGNRVILRDNTNTDFAEEDYE